MTHLSTQDEPRQPAALALLKWREKKTVPEFLKSIPEYLRATVEQACTDPYDGFANAIKEVLPHVKLVSDGFHVTKLYRAAVDDLRKQDMKEPKKILRKEQCAGLKGVMWKLRRNFDDLSEEDRQLLELLFEFSPALRQAHALREKLTAEQKLSKEEATRPLSVWTEKVNRSGLTCFLGTLENWLEEISNYFISGLSSGWVEGFNNKTNVLKRRCYGLRNIGNLFRRICLDLKGCAVFA